VVLGLGHTNWLYTPQGSVDPTVAKQVWLTQEPWYGSSPGARGQLPPTSVPGMLEGFENYARFMVRHFRDRVRYFEVWNEENVCWNDESDCLCPKYFSGPAQYCQWLRRAAAIIRAEAPEARIVMGGMSPGIYCATDIEFLQGCMEEGAAELVDVIAWHAPLLVPTLDRSDYAQTKIYEKQVAEVKELAESHGFRGEYHANEWGVSAPYPQLEGAGGTVGSELAKAKYLARLVLLHHQLDITTCWCEPWNEQEVWDIGLFRNTFSADPISPQQPQAAYYVMRTLCTVLENTAPASGICVHVGEPSRRFASVQLAAGNGDLLVAVWVHEKASEEFAAVPCDVTISGTPLSRAVGIDLLNGTEQVLQAERRDRCLVVPGLLLEDYPYLIRLGKSSG